MKKITLPKTVHKSFFLVWFVCIVVFAWVLQWNVFQNINNLFFDPLTTGDVRKDVVIVGIDEVSLARYGAFPWDRDIYANLLASLETYSPRVVGFDILFAESRKGDDVLTNVLRALKTDVVFGSKLEGEMYISPVYMGVSPRVHAGVVNVFPDNDAKVRSIQNYFSYGKECLPSFSKKILTVATKSSEYVPGKCDTEQHLFRYQENINTISFVDVVDKSVPKETLQDKVILIGFATTDLEQDSFFGLFGRKINGVEIHASAIAHMLNNAKLEKVPPYVTLFANILFAFLLALLPFFVKRFTTQIGILVLVAILAFLGAVAGYEFGYKTYIPWAVGLPLFSYGLSLVYSYVSNIRRNEYLKKLFGTYVHPSLLEELISDPKKLKLGGEKRHMTVLFSDVRGFTTFSEKLSPEGLVDLLNDYLNTMSPVILERRGTIDKYIGDAIMAFWNAPVATENHELLAVESALVMQEKLVEFNNAQMNADGMKLGIGIGVNSGDMVVGNMGSDERFNYTVMGDAVNTGSRFEGLTKKYGIVTIVGESTRNAITDEKILFRKLDVMTVKGKSAPTTIYEPLRTSDSMKVFIKTYEQGFEAYLNGDFNTAKNYLASLAEHGDEPSKMLLERMKTIDLSTWKGVWKWDEK
ncbi:MAG: adenylate/guanylate cyclase domain-containing protein [Minisyncoccia bacterium]